MIKQVAMLLLLSAAMSAEESKVTPLFAKDLAGIVGKEGTMTTVEYGPGVSSSVHRHDADFFVYVLEGSVVMQVRGGKETALRQGQTFYESPSDIHGVQKRQRQRACKDPRIFSEGERRARHGASQVKAWL